MLVKLYTTATPFLDEYPWEWEDDRWHEFLCCAVIAALGDAERVREAIATLRALDLTSPAALANLAPGDAMLLAEVLRRHGFTDDSAAQGSHLMSALGRMTQQRWKGHIQRFLRDHAYRMMRELSQFLMNAGLTRQIADKTAVLWLQNVANLPLLDERDEHVRRFADHFGLTMRKVLAAADNTGVNVCLLDDLLALEAAASPGTERPLRRGSRARSSNHARSKLTAV